MAGLTSELAFLSIYKATRAPRLMRPRFRRLRAFCAITLLALAGAGCSFPLGSMFDSSDSGKVDRTGSIRQPAVDPSVTAERARSDDALLAAARELLSRGEASASLPWQNPHTGARGTVTPIAKPYKLAGATCRDFLASYVRGDSESWLQGEACRGERGGWEVRSLKPWASS